MTKRFITLGVLGIIGVLLLGACGLLQEPEEASAPIEAIPLEVDAEEQESEHEESGTEASDDEGSAEEDHVDDVDAPEDDSSSTPVVFSIDPAQSEVRFELEEDLRGERKNVVGITDQVAGEIGLDVNDLSTAQLGTILVNARTLLTDNDFRNRAIQNEILDTGEYEFITFEPKSVEGLPAKMAVGESVSFSIVGDLTIRDIVQETTFEVEATLNSEDAFSGSASAVVSRADYGLNIPSVPNVANVEEDVELYIDFVASR